jgi:hypothetical protein
MSECTHMVTDNRIGPNFGRPLVHRECSVALAEANARADLAERRERELREELIRMAQGFENLAELRLLDNPYYDEALRLADSARALAATDSAEPRAGQPPQTDRTAGSLAALWLADSFNAGNEIEIPSLGVTLRKSADQPAPPTARAEHPPVEES